MYEPAKILRRLGFTEAEMKVYIALSHGSNSARDIIKITRQRRPTVYYAISSLEKRGLVSRTGLEGKGGFAVEPPAQLEALVKERQIEAEKLSADIKGLIPFLENKKSAKDKKPAVAFFEGEEAVRNVVMGSLYCKDKKILSIAPKDNFFWQIGENFAADYVAERVRNRIKTQNLWEEAIDKRIYREFYKDVSEIRILPEIMRGKFTTTIFIYDDKVMYISSAVNSYAILITSKEHTETMRAMFYGLWSASTKYPE